MEMAITCKIRFKKKAANRTAHVLEIGTRAVDDACRLFRYRYGCS